MPLISVVAATAAGIVTAKWNRKSQSEANRINGSNVVAERYDSLTDQVQEERDVAVTELKQLRNDFEAFKESVRSQFSKYRAYIHDLRGQVHELGGTPHEWPKDLDQ